MKFYLLQRESRRVLARSSAGLTACAGPATPLGASRALRPPERSPLHSVLFRKASDRQHAPSIRLEPPRQVLHQGRSLQILIEDPEGIPDDAELVVRYNGLDVTSAFLSQASVDRGAGAKRMLVRVPVVRLASTTEHLIELGYGSRSKGLVGYARLGPPECEAFGDQPVLTTGSFSPSPELLLKIERLARDAGFNPAFAAGLIAQESGFEVRTVSSARAIGLTQVTPIAEEEVARQHPRWPRHPSANGMPAPLLRVLVETGVVNPVNEWRLDEDLSIRGGLEYIELLSERLADPSLNERLKTWFEAPERARTQILLAAYHSGLTRVMGAVDRHGSGWLGADELRAARNYVNRVSSFCDHFSRVPQTLNPPGLARAPAGT